MCITYTHIYNVERRKKVKKVVAILLVLIIACSLIACNSSSNQSKESTAPSSSAPKESTAPESSAPTTEDAATEGSQTAGTVGYITDDVDHFARDTYKIGYFYYAPLALNKLHFEAIKNMESVLNFEASEFSGNDDAETYLRNMEIAATQGFDGYVIESNANVYDRIYEVMNDLGIPYLYTVNAYRDENGANLVPTVVLDQYKNGQTQTQWFYDHYRDYWGDVDESKIVLMSIEYSTSPDLDTRADGVKDKFMELFPDNEILIGDCAGNSLNEQIAYDKAAALISANPDVEHWFITGTIENFGQGAARAIEAAGKEDITLIVTSGANVLPVEWDAGYDGCWVASYAVYNYNYVVPALCGLIALIDGRATWDTLWAESRAPGDICTAYIAGDQMVTKDTYKSVQADIAKEFNLSE